MKNSEIALTAFKEFVFAFNKKIIKAKKSIFFEDVFVCLDKPEGFLRTTYFILNDQFEIIAQCIIVELSYDDTASHKFQIGWCVDENHRKKGFGKKIVKKSILDFFYRNQLHRGNIVLEAIVDVNNLASMKIAKLLFMSPCKVLQDDAGDRVCIYQRKM